MAVENGVENASTTGGRLHTALLDSNLITQTNKHLFDIKLYKCGDFLQLYKYGEKHMKIDKSLSPLVEETKPVGEEGEAYSTDSPSYNEIRLDNAMRSKLNIERIIKTNQKEFKTFITLTIAREVTNIAEANIRFNIWRGRIKKVFTEFKYICVPEYQKRGVVHYHLLTNIPQSGSIITLQKGKKNQYDVPFWSDGFTSVFNVDNVEKIATYMSKYLTKNIDNRLFGRRRYFYSKNLKIPKVEYLNTSDTRVINYINDLLKNKNLCYSNKYHRRYIDEEIVFKEYITCDL